jgi:hypothetical protein
MKQLLQAARRLAADIARRHGFSVEAKLPMLDV